MAQIVIGAQMNQTIKAIQEAQSYQGPSLVIAYSPCEEHGYDLAFSYEQMKQLTASGFWPLYRFDPRREQEGENPLILDSRAPNQSISAVLNKEQRFSRLFKIYPDKAMTLANQAQRNIEKKYALLNLLAEKTTKAETE